VTIDTESSRRRSDRAQSLQWYVQLAIGSGVLQRLMRLCQWSPAFPRHQPVYKVQQPVGKRDKPAQIIPFFRPFRPALLAALYPEEWLSPSSHLLNTTCAAGLRPGTSPKNASKKPGMPRYRCPNSYFSTISTCLRCSVEFAKLPVLMDKGFCWKDELGRSGGVDLVTAL
jgi:hypothetical protein